MTTLVIGGTGNTGLALAELLYTANHSFLLASRSGGVPKQFTGKGVKFDWLNASTHENPFKVSSDIDRVYMVLPLPTLTLEDASPIIAFVDLAKAKGVNKFVLLSGTAVSKGAYAHGKLWVYLGQIGVEYTILRPTAFQENFATFPESIKEMNAIITAAGDGKVPFISVQDVGQAAYKALFEEKYPNSVLNLIGPTLYTHDEVAALLTAVLGRQITHIRSSAEKLAESALAMGVSKETAQVLFSRQETEWASGSEEAPIGKSNTVTGKVELKDFFENNKQVWM